MTTLGHSTMAQPQKKARNRELEAQLKDQAKKNYYFGGKETREAEELPPCIFCLTPLQIQCMGWAVSLTLSTVNCRCWHTGICPGGGPLEPETPGGMTGAGPAAPWTLAAWPHPLMCVPGSALTFPLKGLQQRLHSTALAPDLFPSACTSTTPLIGLPATLVGAESLTLPSEELSPGQFPKYIIKVI